MTQSAWSASKTVIVGSAATPTIVTTSPLPAATLSVPYLTTLAATGPGPITWEVQSGSSLPAGLTLNATTGVISGTPTTTTGSPFSFNIRAQNGNGWGSAVSFSLTVAAASSNVAASIASLALPTGEVGSAYSYQLVFAGTTPITVATSTLPAGWSCTSGGLLTNSNPGAALDNYQITFTPSNVLGAGDAKTLGLTVNAAPAPAAAPPYRTITDRSGAGPFAKRTLQ